MYIDRVYISYWNISMKWSDFSKSYIMMLYWLQRFVVLNEMWGWQ